jgi:hypothetical protein
VPETVLWVSTIVLFVTALIAMAKLRGMGPPARSEDGWTAKKFAIFAAIVVVGGALLVAAFSIGKPWGRLATAALILIGVARLANVSKE